MKRYSFVLIEVIIAIALLALCAFPFISQPLLLHKEMIKKLFDLELEREAEKIYYELLKKEIPFSAITTAYSTRNTLPSLVISIDDLGKKTYYPHYHLYHNMSTDHKGDYYKVFIAVCFEDCKDDQKYRNYKYKFEFVGKKIAKNPSSVNEEQRDQIGLGS